MRSKQAGLAKFKAERVAERIRCSRTSVQNRLPYYAAMLAPYSELERDGVPDRNHHISPPPVYQRHLGEHNGVRRIPVAERLAGPEKQHLHGANGR